MTCHENIFEVFHSVTTIPQRRCRRRRNNTVLCVVSPQWYRIEIEFSYLLTFCSLIYFLSNKECLVYEGAGGITEQKTWEKVTHIAIFCGNV